MKSSKVLGFIAGTIAIIICVWAVFPASGIEVLGLHLRFASMEEALNAEADNGPDVNEVINRIQDEFELSKDTLGFYKDFLTSNPDRILVPDNDYRYFDSLFKLFENSAASGQTYRVLHLGDSQIEGDRISGIFRQSMQEKFGGMGGGMFPAMSSILSSPMSISTSGDFIHYTMYGDSTTTRAPHRRYGPMAQLDQLSGSGTISFRPNKSTRTKELVKNFSTVSMLIGHYGEGFTARLKADTVKTTPFKLHKDTTGVEWLTWKLSTPVSKATLTLEGNAEIYAISTDGTGGIAVDNVPLRGCSGTIFSRIDKNHLGRALRENNTRLILMEFGGNYMPSISGDKVISQYMKLITKQLQYFHEVAPQAKIIFIGPSDMGKSVNGKIVTWPRLPQLVDSLKTTVLKNDAAFWDMYSVMGGENSMARWVKHSPQLAGADHIHFTPRGADIIGSAFSNAFLTMYDFYCLRKELPEDKVKSFMNRKEEYE